jgi:branched-chain amino acid aminotransferase
MAQERVAYFNGEIVPESEARVSFRDGGFMAGDAVFDTTRTFNHKIFKLNEHLDRFFQSLKYLRMNPILTKKEFAEITHQVLEANLPLIGADDDYWVSQRVSRGVMTPEGERKQTVIVECLPLPFERRAKYYRDGLPVVVPSIRRTPPESMSPRAKMHNYINLILADQEVKANNPDAWPILLDVNGNLSEGPGSNIFIVKDGVVISPKEQYILAGISRDTVVELAHELNITVQEADIDLYDAYTADEAFVTSTSFCICPVSSFNGNPVADGCVPGPVTDRLMKAYSGMVGLDIAGQYLSRL